MLGEAKILTYSSCKDACKALIWNMHVLLFFKCMVVYKVWYYYYVIYFCIPFVQGATVFYWRIWQNLQVACKALSRQLLSICSVALLSNYKTIYRPFENGMFNELYCCDANGCPAVWSKCNLGKSIHYWRAVPLALSRKVVFLKWHLQAIPPSSTASSLSSSFCFFYLTITLSYPMGCCSSEI